MADQLPVVRLAACLCISLLAHNDMSYAEGPTHPPSPQQYPDAADEAVVPLASHHAVYRLRLAKSVGSKAPMSAEGRVSYEFKGTRCTGYKQVFRQVTRMQPAEGSARVSDMRSVTDEGSDGRRFSFNVATRVDRKEDDVVDGTAIRGTKDVLTIQLKQPEVQTLTVKDDVLFPTAHLKRILREARAGRHLFAVRVFDGSDNGKKIYETTTIIGRPITKSAPVSEGETKISTMRDMRRWPVTISYFDTEKKDESPVYTLAFELYENGVSRALRFDYGDFTLAGDLETLEMLPVKACDQ